MRWLLTSLIGCMACLGAGCDTVAELSFDNEQVIDLEPLGFVGTSCASFEGVDTVLRFNVMTSLDARLEPGMQLAGMEGTVLPGVSFGAQNIQFSDSWLFEVDADGSDVTCETATTCQTGASCLTPDEMGLSNYYYAPKRYCVFPVVAEVVGAPTYTHYREVPVVADGVTSLNRSGRTVGFVMDNSATLDGSAVDGSANDDVATDPWQYRRVGLTKFFETLTLGQEAGPFEFSAHFANGVGIDGVYDASSAWLRTVAQWDSAVMDKFPTPSGASPIWEAAQAGIMKIIDKANTAYARSLVVFTDGAPNEGAEAAHMAFMKGVQSATGLGLSWLDYAVEGQGPVRAYADAVALQCGSYYYFNTASQIPQIMHRVSLATAGWWDIGLTLGVKPASGKLYRLATTVVVSLGDGAASFEAQRKQKNEVIMDDRLVLVK